MNRIEGFLPIANADARLLILGSMPSVQSLAKQQYYGHPRNHFWALMSAVLDDPAPDDYDARKDWLVRHRVAVWDTLQSCERKGSLDTAIQKPCCNPLDVFITEHNDLRAIAFNGSSSKQHFRAHFSPPERLALFLLPSSSPIPRPGFVNAQDKLPAWLALREFLID